MLLRRLSIFFCFVLSACSAEKEWVCRNVLSNSSQFASTQQRFVPKDPSTGIGIEILNGHFGTVGYLDIASRQIPVVSNDSNKSLVLLQIDGKNLTYEATRMQGGQRLLLPEQAIEELVAALEQKLPITIFLDGYMSKLYD